MHGSFGLLPAEAHADLNGTVPGGLLRFSLLVNITSNLYADDFKLMTVKVCPTVFTIPPITQQLACSLHAGQLPRYFAPVIFTAEGK